MKLTLFLPFAVAVSVALAQAQNASDPPAKESKVELSPDEQKKAEEEAMKKEMEKVESFGWIREGKGDIGTNAEIDVVPGFRLTKSPSAAQKLVQYYDNPVSGRELAILAAEDLHWFALFTFQADGYVKDTDKDEIDADKIMEAMKENQVEGNKERKAKGVSALYITGWKVKPFYNESSKSLEYGFLLKDEDGNVSLNYKTVVLGRRGVMNVILVCAPELLDTSLPELRESLKGFRYKSGETYAEYKKGDRVAEYTVGGLIAAGGLAVMAKTGILAKLGKFIIVIIAAIGAAIAKGWNWIKGLFTSKKSGYGPPPMPPQ